MTFVGVDGCKAGWLAIQLGFHEKFEVNIFKEFYPLWQEYRSASLILIDIPIGLRQGSTEKGSWEREERRCDKEARKALGPKRAPCVFRVPCRPAIYAQNYDEAIIMNEILTGTRIFKATWNIVNKIRQVDEFLLSVAAGRRVVREVHPEICFWALNGCHPMAYSKATENGYQERLLVLNSVFPLSNKIFDSCRDTSNIRQNARRDDILDALSAAITARLGFDQLHTLPESPEIDSQGLPMEMVYFPCQRPDIGDRTRGNIAHKI